MGADCVRYHGRFNVTDLMSCHQTETMKKSL